MSRADRDPLTVSEVVREAAGIVDPSDTLARIGDFERWFEDDDEPVRTVPNFDRRIAGAVDDIDPEGDDPGLAVAAAVAIYLATEPRHLPDDAEAIIEQAVRSQFQGDVPDAVGDWLAGRV
jgi:hypothetical protein